MKLGIPGEIQRIIGKETYSLDKVGMSGSEVRIYDNHVLKIEPQNEETDNAYAITKWLNQQLPVPTMLAYCVKNGMAYTLMSKMGGKMLCAREYLKEPEQLIKIAAQGLKCLWEIDVTECAYQSSRLMKRLEAAEYNVMHDLVDLDNVEPETFGPNGFRNPEELLKWLKNNRPDEDIVFTHGDYCLPNIFVTGSKINGFIDIGKMGPADRWQDVAIAIRSLTANFAGRYSDGKKICDFNPQMFLDELGIDYNGEKHRNYLLLDELF